MRTLTLQEMAAAIEGRVYGEITRHRVSSVSTDSRTAGDDCLFFALVGERHDGHTFVEEVLERGASAAVVSELSKIPQSLRQGGRIVQVPDTVAALGRLAAWYRRQIAAEVVAVVGSNGKTTTKDLIATVLRSKRRGQAALKSFNNSIGVPLTLLAAEPADQFVVLEIGTNHPGEIAALTRMAQPDMAVITSIGEEHLEFFGNIEGVAGEEFSILTTMGRRGFVVMSDQAATYAPADAREGRTVLVYGFEERADLRATDLTSDGSVQRFRVNGRYDYELPAPGRHNVVNALAAVAIGRRFRMTDDEIATALKSAKLPDMRMQIQRLGTITVWNDAYNANPSSMRAAFAVLDETPHDGRKVLILGDMRELGGETERCHQALGRDAGRTSAKVIISVGSQSRVVADGATSVAGTAKRIYAFPSVEMLTEKIDELIGPGDLVLLKGSRAMQLERLIEPIGQCGEADGRPVSVCRAGAAM